MKTVKEVSDITGISVRTLQYYDEIGLLKPTKVNEQGYRFYDDNALDTLQQILFFKELDFPLKDIKAIMENPNYDRLEAFKRQKALLTGKRDRLNSLLELLTQLTNGEDVMNFQAFDLSSYLEAVDHFAKTHPEDILTYWGSQEAFGAVRKQMEDHEEQIAKLAVQVYGSVEAFCEAMKQNMEHFDELMQVIQEKNQEGIVRKNQMLMDELIALKGEVPASMQVQELISAIFALTDDQQSPTSQQLTPQHIQVLADSFLHKRAVIDIFDTRYGKGSAAFVGEALQYYAQTRNKEVL